MIEGKDPSIISFSICVISVTENTVFSSFTTEFMIQFYTIGLTCATPEPIFEEMKTFVILYAGDTSMHLFDAVFDGMSACDLSLSWAQRVTDICGIELLSGSRNYENCLIAAQKTNSPVPVEVTKNENWTPSGILHYMADICKDRGVDFVLYVWADCPFLNDTVTEKIINTHVNYRAEYTFADGYPYGLAPEALDGGTAGILAELTDTNVKTNRNKLLPIKASDRGMLFSVLKQDINAFEIETIIAPEDWRQLRLELECGSKRGLAACKALFPIGNRSAEELSRIAATSPCVLRTYPAFYNIQIESSCTGTCIFCPYPEACKKKYGTTPKETDLRMPIEAFSNLMGAISDFSEIAVVSLSAWGEPLNHPQFQDFVAAVLAKRGLSVLIETTGVNLTPELCEKIAELASQVPTRTNGFEKIMWIVSVDAVTVETYGKLHGFDSSLAEKEFTTATSAVALLQKYFPGSVYPQFLRVKQNENELEQFFRFWNDKNNPSGGNLIIQKYDNFCGLLPSDKPADLSPIERNPCWHLRRDMTILVDGSVPYCRELVLDGTAGNVFRDPIEKVWEKFGSHIEKHIRKEYPEKCRACDEYYTFNF